MIETRTFHVKHYLDLEVDEFMFKGVVSHIPEYVLYRLADSPYMKTLVGPEGFPLMVIGVVPVSIGISVSQKSTTTGSFFSTDKDSNILNILPVT